MGNFSFICGRHDQNHQIKDELCEKKHFILRAFAYRYYQLEKMNKRKLAVQYFACLVLVAFYLGCVLFYSSFSQPCHISLCALCASSDVRCRFLGHFFFFFPVLAQALRGCLHLVDQHWHRCLNYMYLRSDMLPGSISRIFALLVTSLRIASCYPQ